MFCIQIWIMERVSILQVRLISEQVPWNSLDVNTVCSSEKQCMRCADFITNQHRWCSWCSSKSCLPCSGRISSLWQLNTWLFSSAHFHCSCILQIHPTASSTTYQPSHHMLSLKAFIIYPKSDTSQADRKSGPFLCSHLSGKPSLPPLDRLSHPISHFKTPPEAGAKCQGTGDIHSASASWQQIHF